METTSSRMEDELKCAACRRLYVNPVQLPGCWHHLCYCCAAARLQSVAAATNSSVGIPSGFSPMSPASSISSTSSLTGSMSPHFRLASSVSCQRVDDGCSSGGTKSSASSTSGTETGSDQDSDGVSVVSETDSGVVVVVAPNIGSGSNATTGSRPGSCMGNSSIPGSSSSSSLGKSTSSLSLQSDTSTGSGGGGSRHSSASTAAYVIVCPACSRVAPVEGGNVGSLPRPRALEAIVDRYRESRSLSIDCQLCVAAANGTASGPSSPRQQMTSSSSGTLNPATRVCEPCELYYCGTCTHPENPGGHRVIGDVIEGKRMIQSHQRDIDGRCVDHRDELRSLYCLVCRATVCCACVQHGRHVGHQTQPMGAMCRAQKSELSQLIHGLSEKARSGTEFIARLKCMQDRIETNCTAFEEKVAAECDALVAAIRWRQQQLVAGVRREKALKQQSYRDQVTQCTAKVHRTTGLLQFSVEVMKETEPTAFLQVSSPLIKRVAQVDSSFVKEVEFEPRVSTEFELQLDRDPVVAAIHSMNFLEMKVPNAPRILVRESSVLNNTITFVWEATQSSGNNGNNVNGYALELDDGNGGEFREVFCGKETICTVEGLHFDTSYVARVKAFNTTGHGPYSQSICLRTAKVAWFNFDASSASRDVLFSNDNRTVTTSSFDDRVVLGSVGVTRGVHYWEVVVDRYENNKDPAFGIARVDVAKDKLLGADSKGWSMYIDAARSWFMHSGVHTARTEGGIAAGSVVGILLDLDRRLLSFYLDGEHHGPIAFTEPSAGLGQGGVFYPAVSVNRNVQLTLHSGLAPPVDNDSDDGSGFS